MNGMTRVIIESPYAGDIEQNLAYARTCLKDSLSRGEAPIAWHLLYTQNGVLRDDVPKERELGINAGVAWLDCAELVAVYADLGITQGMREGINRAQAAGLPVYFRSLKGRDTT